MRLSRFSTDGLVSLASDLEYRKKARKSFDEQLTNYPWADRLSEKCRFFFEYEHLFIDLRELYFARMFESSQVKFQV